MRSLRIALAGLMLLVGAPATAQAADVSLSGATLAFTAGDNEPNNVTVSLAGGTYTVADSGATVTPGAGCSAAGANAVTCPSAGVTTLTLDGRDLADTIAIGAGTAAATINGGEGDDTLTGGSLADTI